MKGSSHLPSYREKCLQNAVYIVIAHTCPKICLKRTIFRNTLATPLRYYVIFIGNSIFSFGIFFNHNIVHENLLVFPNVSYRYIIHENFLLHTQFVTFSNLLLPQVYFQKYSVPTYSHSPFHSIQNMSFPFNWTIMSGAKLFIKNLFVQPQRYYIPPFLYSIPYT